MHPIIYPLTETNQVLWPYGCRPVKNDGKRGFQCLFCYCFISDHDIRKKRLMTHYRNCRKTTTPLTRDQFEKAEKSFFSTLENVEKSFGIGAVDKTRLLSFRASYLLAKHGISYKAGAALAKELLQTQAKICFNVPDSDKKAFETSLTTTTVKRRVTKMADDILSQLLESCKNSPVGIAIQLDGSTDFAGKLAAYLPC